jgi:hypothetical protein
VLIQGEAFLNLKRDIEVNKDAAELERISIRPCDALDDFVDANSRVSELQPTKVIGNLLLWFRRGGRVKVNITLYIEVRGSDSLLRERRRLGGHWRDGWDGGSGRDNPHATNLTKPGLVAQRVATALT